MAAKHYTSEEWEQRLEEISEEVCDEIAMIQQHKNDTNKQIELLVAIIVKQSKTLSHMQKRVLDQERRSMKSNILIHSVPEKANEDIDKIVITSLTKLGIPEDKISLDISHRKGPPRNPGAKPRPIIAKMVKTKDTQFILERTKLKKGEKPNPEALHVTPQVPEELREQQKKLQSLADVFRKKDNKAKVAVKGDHIVVNKEKIKDPVGTPSTQDILYMSDANKTAITNTPITTSQEVCEKGSRFWVLTTTVRNPEDARITYLKVRSMPQCATTTHLISAYLFANGCHSWEDDGDFGLGRYLLKIMENKGLTNRIIFLSREFGGVHLGQRRFDIVRELVDEVLTKEEKRKNSNAKTSSPFAWASGTVNGAGTHTPPEFCPIVSSDTSAIEQSDDNTIINMDADDKDR